MYVTLVPWRRERRRHVPSPPLLYHRWAAGPRLGSSAKTWICAAPAAYLCSRCYQRQLDAIIACQCALARLVYILIGLVSLSEIRLSSDVMSPFPPSGNEGYISNRDVFCIKLVLFHSSWRRVCMGRLWIIVMALTLLFFFCPGKVRHKFLYVLSTPVRLCRFLRNTGSLHSHAATIMATLKDQDPIKPGSVK